MVLVVIGLLAKIGSQRYWDSLDRVKVAKAIGDMQALQTDIDSFETDNNRLPTNLAEIGRTTLLDPWGAPYVYMPFTGPGSIAAARKDRSLVPINSTYDLYSMGADGQSQAPLAARPSRDDIVRVNDGGFIGPASNF